MIAIVGLSTEVGNASALLAVLLVLVTLFTSDRATRVAAALNDPNNNGAFPRAIRLEIEGVTTALALVTVGAIIGLFQLAGQAIATSGGSRIDPVLWMFVLVWFLLGGLVVWQASIIGRCAETAAKRNTRLKIWVPCAVGAVLLADLGVLVWGLVARPA
jgi:hypothetical protein